MIRLLILVGMLLAAPLPGAEPAPLADARAAAERAEAALAASRLRIAAEQRALLTALADAAAAAAAARTRRDGEETAVAERERTLVALHQDQNTEGRRLAARIDALAAAAGLRAPVDLRPRLEAAIQGIDRRIADLPGRLGLVRREEPVVDRQGRRRPAPVLRLGEARAVALGDEPALRGLLVAGDDPHTWLVTGPELPPGDGIPVDAAGTAAAATHAGMTLAVWLAAGRFFIWPIIAVFALGLAIVAWRAWVLMGRRVDRRRLVTVLRTAARPDRAAAAALVAAGATPLDRVLRAGLDAVDRPPEVRESAVEQVLIHETGDLHRGIPAIAVLAGVAPLLGLLGTVTGMIDMFGVIAAEGSGNATSLSGGISEALVCTQAGMLAAIPLLLAHAWLGRLAERRAQRLEEAACGVLGLSS
jgi:biopolymer transport protein ExbB